MRKKNVIIVGAGPGGLSSAMLLAHRGFDVHIYEKNSQPGGRTSEINLSGYRFDVGPTFFMMKFILDEIFKQTGHKSEDYLKFIRLDPMYRLYFPKNEQMDVFENRENMKKEIKRVFPGEESGLNIFYFREKKRYQKLMPILQQNNQKISDALSWNFLSSIPFFSIGQSIFDEMGKYFSSEKLKLSFTFQAKYLGMSPWECPGAFGLVPYVEHAFGVYHVIGGLSEISRAMAKVAQLEGAKINYNTSVKKIIFSENKATGIELATGQIIKADHVIINADFGYAMEQLIPQGKVKKYSSKKLKNKKISCSIFMLYLGIKKQYKLPHNSIVFAENYKKNVAEVFGGELSGKNISFYIRDHSLLDPSLAPKGKTALYVLLPVPNNRSKIDWPKQKNKVRNILIDALKNRLGLRDIENNIEVEQIITPEDWQNNYNVYEGAVFNLGHNLKQMLWFRPHNQLEGTENLFIVGGGTHPGSGLPTIYESGRITAKLICQKNNINY